MDQLIVALDVDTAEEAVRLADHLRGAVGAFKVGKRLFTMEGPGVVRALVERGDRVFLDLKFHDIPHTVAGAVGAAARLGVWMVNVHASGGDTMMRAARDAAHDGAARGAAPAPLVIAVTVLTSLDARDLARMGVARSVVDQVGALADLAQHAGLDGVVASPQETRLIRDRCGAGFRIVTPGIRSVAGGDDQARTMSASDAIAAGADYLVVGRPIIAARDPRAAAETMASEIREAGGSAVHVEGRTEVRP